VYARAVAAVDRRGSAVDGVPHFARVSGGRPTTSKQLLRTTVTNPHGTTTDFWGPRPPELAWVSCTQAPRAAPGIGSPGPGFLL
jgi:hypothetical protein